jgi:hypothetical protein
MQIQILLRLSVGSSVMTLPVDPGSMTTAAIDAVGGRSRESEETNNCLRIRAHSPASFRSFFDLRQIVHHVWWLGGYGGDGGDGATLFAFVATDALDNFKSFKSPAK